ncbi:conserved hypothetical protein [Candidatus Desulfarcum epimagneticum]|uniref:Lipopolysaccharide assembly protein A domain-containing protein n=1 Tax=uncultured Desulfobacteraceae bacterium TaxID=218296 RepID=A0A484HIS6_9BACT|nr:conserved hypothetical protein [uncultured Desulfobacteraceae bacterium]
MKKMKMVFFVVLAGLCAALFFQNQEFFLTRKSLGIDLWAAAYRTPEISILILALALFVSGVLIGAFFSLSKQMKQKKSIRILTADLKVHRQKIDELEKRLEFPGSPAAQTPVEEPEARETRETAPGAE